VALNENDDINAAIEAGESASTVVETSTETGKDAAQDTDEPKVEATESDPADDAGSSAEGDDTEGETESEAVDPDLIDLGDGKTATQAELIEVYKFYEGSKDSQAQRGAYLRNRESLASDRKAFEAERETYTAKGQEADRLQQAYEADPVQFARNAIQIAVQDGIVHPQAAQLLEQAIEQAAQGGFYQPHIMQARAAQIAAQRQAQEYAQRNQGSDLEKQVWGLQTELGRILTQEERQKMFNAIEYAHVHDGKRISFKEAYDKVQSLKPPAAPVIGKSAVKTVQALKKTKPTMERANGAGKTSQSYTKADIDRDLNLLFGG
jgi:hypothetical protein